MSKRTVSSAAASHSARKAPRIASRGRQNHRVITRTARRGENETPVEENASELDSADEQPDLAKQPPKLDDSGAYNALLVLLDADKPRETRAARKSTPKVDDTEIAGANESDNDHADDDSADEAAEAEIAAEENDDDISRDPFEARFNLVLETLVEKHASDSAPWTILDRAAVQDQYTTTTQTPPGGALDVWPAKGSVSRFSLVPYLKPKVRTAFTKSNSDDLSDLDANMASHVFAYRDVCFPTKTHTNTLYRKLAAAHVVNHVAKTRDRVLRNNDKLRQFSEDLKAGKIDPSTMEPELRDQGFTRPRTLVLLPTRNAAHEWVELLIAMSGAEQVENRKRFRDQFFDADGVPDTKPADFRAMFKGNSNDFFCLGLKFTRKAVKLYSSFYNLDAIVASPIGLAMILEDPKKSQLKPDFLASIEVLVVDNANQIEMQNWDHFRTVMKYVNKIPKEFHDADFSRIRMWSINDHASLLRQSLVFCEYLTPAVNSVLSKSQNIGGKVRYKPVITSQTCIMNSVGLRIQQMFQRFEAASPAAAADARFKFFTSVVYPSLSKNVSYDDGLLVYIPSYFDYLRVKSYMKEHTRLDFVAIDEYSSPAKTTRNRQRFALGKSKLMLYTERLHHFRRFEIAGVKTVLIYEPPTNPLFYKELLRFIGRSVFKGMADKDLSFVKTMFCKWDGAALERIVGNERAPVLCNSVNESYEFR